MEEGEGGGGGGVEGREEEEDMPPGGTSCANFVHRPKSMPLVNHFI